MSRPRCQLSLAALCGIVALSAVGLSQNTFPRAVFAVTWVFLLAATTVCVFRPQPFWWGFVISGASYLLLSRLFASPPPVGQAEVMLAVHSILALTLATFVGTWVRSCNPPRNSRPSC
jgi:hypothetical protein